MLLHQILSLKSLGFSLKDIKSRLISLKKPDDVAKALTEQADVLRKNIEQLKDSLIAIEQLKAEVLQIQTVNFKKYADIIVKLQMRYLHIHFVWDKLCAFWAILFSFRFRISLNTLIVSRLEFFGITLIAGGSFVSHLTERYGLKTI